MQWPPLVSCVWALFAFNKTLCCCAGAYDDGARWRRMSPSWLGTGLPSLAATGTEDVRHHRLWGYWQRLAGDTVAVRVESMSSPRSPRSSGREAAPL